MPFEWFGVLSGQVGQSAALVVAVLYGGYKFRRIKSILGGVVGAIGTMATFGALVVGAIVLGTATGWVSIDIGQALSDLSAAGRTAWNAAGKEIVDWVVSEVMG